MTRRPAFRVGVVSDTHGLLRPEAVAFLHGCDHIVHAGDIGSPGILAALAAIAPLTAIRGNIDTATWATVVPETTTIELACVRLHLVHDLRQLAVDPVAAGIGVVVSGHSHKAHADTRAGVLYLNPGSCGPRRFRLPVTVANLCIRGHRLETGIVDLSAGAG